MNYNAKWENSHFGKGFSSNHVTYKQLTKRRGWTNALITKFLGEPDYTGSKVYGDKCYPVKFYHPRRVREIEQMGLLRKPQSC